MPIPDNHVVRGMKVDGHYQICGLEGEFLNHVIFEWGLIFPLSIPTFFFCFKDKERSSHSLEYHKKWSIDSIVNFEKIEIPFFFKENLFWIQRS